MLCLIIIVGPTDEYRREPLYINIYIYIYYQYHNYWALGSIFQIYGPLWVCLVLHKQGDNLTTVNSSQKEGHVRFTSKRQHLTKIFANRGRKGDIMCYHISSSSSLTHTWVKIITHDREGAAPHSHILNTQLRVAVVSYLHEKYHKSGGRFKLDFMKARHVFIGYNPNIMTVYVRKAVPNRKKYVGSTENP